MDRDQQLKAALFWKLPLLFQFCKGDIVINSNSSFDEDVTKKSQITLDYITEDFSNLDYSQFEEMCKKDEIRKFRIKFRNDVLRLLKDLGCINQKQLWQWSTNQKNSRSSVPTETDTTTSFSP
ncbi:C-C chemokine receptor type 7 [Crotalus adamanteus]|uniref:C-C chemokine receptor type 7 n=1 Tax=Crotalus adamanteus TaxID=8729 RepID=A0AAW1B4A5_CROAD